jgi:hypothetical protein
MAVKDRTMQLAAMLVARGSPGPPRRPDRGPVQSLFTYTHAGQGPWFATADELSVL